MTLNFLGRLSKNFQIPNFMKFRPLGAQLFPTDRHDEANSGFSQFCASRLKSVFEKRMFTPWVNDLHNDLSLME